jgi:hypothetical protein
LPFWGAWQLKHIFVGSVAIGLAGSPPFHAWNPHPPVVAYFFESLTMTVTNLRPPSNAGVVDQRVDAPEALFRRRDDFMRRCAIPDVAGDRQHLLVLRRRNGSRRGNDAEAKSAVAGDQARSDAL